MEKVKNYLAEKTYFPRKFINGLNINLFIPIAIILGVVPLIVHVATVPVDDATVEIYGKAVLSDLFSQWKYSFLTFFSVILLIMCILFFKKLFEKKDKITNLILIFSFIFLIFTLFSAIFSEYKQEAFFGFYDRAEGFITIACYFILFIYSVYSFKTTSNYKYLIIPVTILVVFEAFLGIFQYTGHDLINSSLGLFIATGKTSQKLSLAFESGKLYGTLYHYNFVGSFVGITLPIFFSLAIFAKKIIYKLIYGIGALLSIWLLLGSTSRAGIIGIVFSFFFGLIIFGRAILMKWKIVLIGLISIVILAVGLNFATSGVIFQRVPSLLSDSLSILNDTSDFNYSDYTPIKDIRHVDGHIELVLPSDTLKIYYENKEYTFKDSKDQIVSYSKQSYDPKFNKDNIYTLTDTRFSNLSFVTQRINGKSTFPEYLYLQMNNSDLFMFRLRDNNSLHLINPNTREDMEVAHPETVKLLNGKEKLGSARGYIWSRSIPLIKNNLILGSGPDTFIYQFPQTDFIGKYYAYNTPNMVVDKPHNLYLQIALNDGLIALLAFLAIIILYLLDSIKLYALKKDYDSSQVFGIANCLGVIGYLFAGLFNDSVISVAPIFWIVLGVGVSINSINRKKLKATLSK